MQKKQQESKIHLSRRGFITAASAAAMTLPRHLMANSNQGQVSIVQHMTADNLRGAFGGESMAYMRYILWANHADKDNKPNVARLFRAIAEAEKFHADNHFEQLGAHKDEYLAASMGVFGLGTTSENLQGGIDGEVFEVEQMYPAFLAVARAQNESGAIQSFEYALAAEKEHITLFTKAKQATDQGRDVDLGPVHVCDVCGYTIEGDIPDQCPICGHSRNHFVTFE